MQALRDRVQGLVLLTATPMQVSPVEVWDLLALLGLPPEWHTQAFLDFFDYAAKPSPSHAQLGRWPSCSGRRSMRTARLSDDEAARLLPGMSRLKVRKILRALRDRASIPLKQLETAERQAAIRLMKANTPAAPPHLPPHPRAAAPVPQGRQAQDADCGSGRARTGSWR